MTTDHRRAPRRRGAELEAAIFRAVLDELAERGYAAMSMDAVARRAGVSKASIYRRWPGKADLMVSAAYRLLPGPDTVADTGTLRGDLIAALSAAAAQLAGPAGDGMRGILGDVLRDPGAAAQFRAVRQGRGAATIAAVVARAAARGECPPAAPAPRVLEVGHAMLRHEFLFGGSVSDEFVVSVVDDVILPLLQVPAGQGRP